MSHYKEAIKVLESWLEKNRNGTNKFYFIDSLVRLSQSEQEGPLKISQKSIEDDIQHREGKFSRIDRAKSEAVKLLENSQEQLLAFSVTNDQNNRIIPKIKDELDGSSKVCWIDYDEISPDDKEIKEPSEVPSSNDLAPSLESNQVHYSAEDLKPLWFKFMHRDFERNVLKIALFSNVVIILSFLYFVTILLVFFLCLILDVCLFDFIYMGIFPVVILSILYHFIGPYQLAYKNNIAFALSFTYQGLLGIKPALLMYKINQRNTDNPSKKILRLVAIDASCPICDREVEIKRNKDSAWRELIPTSEVVGVCRANPLNHRFTFDHTTLRGERIS